MLNSLNNSVGTSLGALLTKNPSSASKSAYMTIRCRCVFCHAVYADRILIYDVQAQPARLIYTLSLFIERRKASFTEYNLIFMTSFFVNELVFKKERLVALETVNDSIGQGLFKYFKNITKEYAINWREHLCTQSYNGAACMQGVYSGLSYIYIWCFAHQLNLVVIDTCDCCEDTRNFFGEIRSLVTYLRARKRTSTFVKNQKELYPKEQVLHLRNFSDTRWTSHCRVIDVIYTKFKKFRYLANGRYWINELCVPILQGI
ncbi:hypothetical protein AGLY_017712 [Aphis glycines]|uniref:DUF4371 domain-containing protein n=1 Tax=Aphis glycines TaxID=307491 RepID=A0A6G0SUX7_APHGL|nr:hypothetical protein AGLY_017712 [Aphis glycines]